MILVFFWVVLHLRQLDPVCYQERLQKTSESYNLIL